MLTTTIVAVNTFSLGHLWNIAAVNTFSLGHVWKKLQFGNRRPGPIIRRSFPNAESILARFPSLGVLPAARPARIIADRAIAGRHHSDPRLSAVAVP